jgi:hypothetical protein
MIHSSNLPHALVAACLLLAGTDLVTATAQAPSDEVHINAINVPRPMSVAARQVERRFGRVVTYEDLSYVAPSEIVDVTMAVRRDGRLGDRIYGMRSGNIEIAYTPARVALDEQVAQSLSLLVSKWNASDAAGQFKVAAVAGGYHLIPIARKGTGESLEPYTAPLDARISFRPDKRDGFETVAAIAEAVSSVVGRPVTPGMMPLNLLRRVQVEIGADNEVARDVLWQVLQDIDRSLSWQVLCEVGERGTCAINVHQAAKG